MDRRTFLTLTLASLAGLILAACDGGSAAPGGGAGAGTPDLVPIPQISSFNPLSFSFCKRDDDGLHVTVKNQGTGTAPQSITRIDFGSAGGPFDVPTSSLNPGISVVLTHAIPLGCFNPDCDFTIIVNHGDTVDEAGADGNNEVSDRCIG